ncbi:MAG: hypothetical protein Fur0022_24020 [Anaerolineales bacterium]
MRSRLLFVFAAILWVAAVTGSYYLTHKPFDLEIAQNIALAGWRILIAGAILSVGGGLGGRLIPGSRGGTLFERAAQAAMGLGLLGTGIWAVGSWVGLGIWFFALLLVGLIILLRRDILAWWQSWQHLPEVWRSGGRLGQIIALGTAILLGWTLFTALAPPLKFDALVYHLTLPQIYLTAGRIDYQPTIFWGMPQLMEMLFTWGMALGGMETGPVLAWGIALLTLLGLADWGAYKMSPRAGWVAAACLLGGFTLAISLAWGYVDWLVMLLGLAGMIWLAQWQETGARRPLILAGVVAGFAMGTKYTAGVFALGAVLIIFLRTGRAGWQAIKNALIFSVPVLLAASPWLLKNLIATGNPFYPLLFPAGEMNATRLAVYQSPLLFGDWRDAVLLPWRATMLGIEGGVGYSASIGPLLLAFGLLGFLQRGHPALSVPKIIALTGLVFWAITGRVAALALQTRLVMVIFPALALVAGFGFERLAQIQLPGVRLTRVAGVVLLVVFGFNILEVSVYSLRQGAIQHFLGLTSTNDYLSANLGMTALAYQAIHALPEDARVLMLWEPRSLYCLPRCIPDEIVDRWLLDRAVYGSVEEIGTSWTEYTHLLVYHTGANFYRHDPTSPYRPTDWETLDELLASLPVQTDLNGVYTLYKLTP